MTELSLLVPHENYGRHVGRDVISAPAQEGSKRRN